MLKKAIFLPLILIVHFAFAQQKQIDSLKRLLSTTKADTLKIWYNYQLSIFSRDNTDTTLSYIDRGMRLSQAINNSYYVAYGKYRYGASYLMTGNYPVAIKNIFEALQLNSTLNRPVLTAQCYAILAEIYDDQKDEKKAIYYTQLAIPIAKAVKDNKHLVFLYGNTSYFYNRLEQPEMALKYDNLANELAEQLHNDYTSGAVFSGMGKTYFKLKQPDIAFSFLHKAIILSTKSQNHNGLLNCYTYISDYYLAGHQTDSAMVYSLKELAEAKKLSYSSGTMDAMKKLGAAYDGRNQVKATEYYKNALALNEQLFDSEKTREFQNLITADEQQRKEQAEQKRLADEDRKQNLQLAAIALFIPIFILMVFFLSRTKLHRRVIDFMGVLSLLLAFEFITLLAHPLIESLTHHTPVLELVILVIIAGVLVPLHHTLTHWLKNRLSHRLHEHAKEAGVTENQNS